MSFLQDVSMDRSALSRGGNQDATLRSATRKIQNLTLPWVDGNQTTSLFVFGETNFVRRWAKKIIEWGYPFLMKNIAVTIQAASALEKFVFAPFTSAR